MQYVVSLLFVSICYCLITRIMVFNIFLFCIFVFYFFILCFCIVLFVVSPFVYSCLFPTFVQVYRPLTPGGNPTAINKYCISQHIISYQTFQSVLHIFMINALTFYSLPITLPTTRFNIKKFCVLITLLLRVLYRSQSKQ
jgi:hypothetical protein